MDLTAIKSRQQQTWATGDYAMVGTQLVILAEQLCEAVDLRSGQKVLDVATGSGNTAIAAARRGCEVTGIDYVSALLDRGRERAAAERLEVHFREGDAEAIPFPDGSFDVVLSTLGSMFAPDQEKAASELVRVCRSGGKIGLTNWAPDGFVGTWFRATTRYIPPPPGLKPPVAWGTEERVRELFDEHVTSLTATRRTFTFRFRSPQHWLKFFGTYFGPTIKAFAALDTATRELFEAELLEIATRFNRSGDDTLAAPADYLEVVAVRK